MSVYSSTYVRTYVHVLHTYSRTHHVPYSGEYVCTFWRELSLADLLKLPNTKFTVCGIQTMNVHAHLTCVQCINRHSLWEHSLCCVSLGLSLQSMMTPQRARLKSCHSVANTPMRGAVTGDGVARRLATPMERSASLPTTPSIW